MFDKIDIAAFMLDKLGECDKWLEGKDNAVKALEEAEAKYIEAKKNVEDYTDENVSQVEAYRDDLEAKLVKLGVLQLKEQEEVAPIEEEAVVAPSPVIVM